MKNDFNFFWLILFALFAVLDWTAVWRNQLKLLYIAKPATLLCLLIWSLQMTGWQGFMLFIGAGIVFCLLGDIFLMLRPRFFMYGLLAFMAGQLCYIAGINPLSVRLNTWVLAGAGLFILAMVPVLRKIIQAIQRKQLPESLAVLAAVYGLVECSLVISAALMFIKPGWPGALAGLLTLGAVFFLISDFFLGFSRFVKPIPHGRTWIHITYHLAQFLIIYSLVSFWIV